MRYPGRPRQRTVAVVVPLSPRTEVLPDEEISFRHLCHYLGQYDKYLIAPDGMAVCRDGFVTKHFPRKFFGSVGAYNCMVLWPSFYRAFQQYEYILIHHLDSLVFSDELLQWCRAGFDYVGAPWLPGPDTPWVKEARVGNGGFSLVRVESALQVLRNRYRREPLAYVSDVLARNSVRLQPVYRALETMGRLTGSRLIDRVLARDRRADDPARYGNDYFWAFHAIDYLPTFRIASVDDGLRFAFESYPRTCFEWNGRRLPFGCHAWTKFDRAFWEPFLLQGESGRYSTRTVTACR